MIYLTKESALFADDGRFIKFINCPLASQLARTVSKAAPEQEFYCPNCSSKVKNLRFLTDDQAIDEVQQNADTCFFSTGEAANVVHLTLPRVDGWQAENEHLAGLPQGATKGWPIIRTARGIDEMNFAVRNGLTVIPRMVGTQAGATGRASLYQEVDTGLYSLIHDIRQQWIYSEYADWKKTAKTNDKSFRTFLLANEYPEDLKEQRKVFNFFSFNEDELAPPVAGYIIPSDLKPGTKLFIEDVIEHRIQSYPQGQSERLPSWWGVWTGSDVVLADFKEAYVLG